MPIHEHTYTQLTKDVNVIYINKLKTKKVKKKNRKKIIFKLDKKRIFIIFARFSGVVFHFLLILISVVFLENIFT